MVSRFARAIVLVLAIAALTGSAFATQTTKQLATGVSLYQDVNTTPGSELIVNCVTVDPKVEGVAIKAALSKDVVCTSDPLKGCERIADLTGRRGAVVGINADFFPLGNEDQGDPLGVCVIDGELVSEPSPPHAVMAMLKDGTFAFDNPTWTASITLANNVSRQIDGINRFRKTNELIAYTGKFGSSTRTKNKGTEVICKSSDLPVQSGKTINLTVVEVRKDCVNTPIPADGMVLSADGQGASLLSENLKPGDTLTVKFEVKSAGNVDWTQVQQALGGRPWVLKDGKEYVDLQYERIGSSFSTIHHPRSALGSTADGKLMIVTVDGRQKGLSGGISLTDLAKLMKKLGAQNAINLDGGGSTTLSYRGMIINSPSGGVQRPVADGLLVFANPLAGDEIPKLTITAPAGGVPLGQGAQLTASCGDDSHALTADQLQHIVWGTAKGNGFLNQQGYMIPNSLKVVPVKVMCGAQSATLDVVAVAGPPANIFAKLVPDTNDPMLSKVSVTVSDVRNNPCVAKPVVLTVAGGKADVPTGSTDDKGQFSAAITWDAAVTQHSVTVTSGSLTTTAAPVAATPAPVTVPATVTTPANP